MSKPWKKSASAPRDGTHFIAWLDIYASPMSMGMSDQFAVLDCWYADGVLVHLFREKPTELAERYFTHWAPMGAVPSVGPKGQSIDIWSE